MQTSSVAILSTNDGSICEALTLLKHPNSLDYF